ncbi:MAG: alpha-glucan family phosphorylase [Gammaproteobacteria bacterium]
MPANRYTIEISPTLPAPLARLAELAENLMYSWDRRIRGLFYFMDAELWDACHHNPKVFLRRIPQPRLDQLANDPAFLSQYKHMLARFDHYLTHQGEFPDTEAQQMEQQTIAYFCMEYGLYESLPLYSGGLGVLAGDYCKAASDSGLPFVAIGLMYRLGYFTQTINAEGEQQAHYQPVAIEDLAVRPARDAAGKQVHVQVSVAGRNVTVLVWELAIGTVRLLLLDTDLADNTPADRSITYQLYGGDRGTRINQEIVLGIGGVRALRALGIQPSVWHINEGHAAFSVLERCRELLAADTDFATALELAAAATLFTTHTPVPAGHDVFNRELMKLHFEHYAGELHLSFDELMALGAVMPDQDSFNMTALALRTSRRHNGVSRVHREVAARMEGHVWPQVPPADNPMDHISNAVHAGTFLARAWVALFDEQHPDWRQRIADPEYWQKLLAGIPDARFWKLRRLLKHELLASARNLLARAYQRNNVGRLRAEQLLDGLDESRVDTLIVGFARRMATYKRALLLFQYPERLARLLNNPERPLIVLFAGKAHPQDQPGQQIIRELNHRAQQPEFAGKIFFLEGHGISLERKLVTGVDVWLNTPLYPLEASGTSGMKAAINGGINLSVLDGWWEEGYDGSNGWAIPVHDPELDVDYRNRIVAEDLLDILEREVLPLYYRRDADGLPTQWIRTSKHSMESVLPRYNTRRMLLDYLHRFYVPALHQSRTLAANGAREARTLAVWKKRVRQVWPQVRAHWKTPPPARLHLGEPLRLAVTADLGELTPMDVHMECCVENADDGSTTTLAFTAMQSAAGHTTYQLEMQPAASGLMHLGVRLYPTHPLLAHRFEMGCLLEL